MAKSWRDKWKMGVPFPPYELAVAYDALEKGDGPKEPDVDNRKPLDGGCICQGNWRAIVKEVESYIGRLYVGHDGETYRFFGVVHGDDDYYYGMYRLGKLELLSCVGSIEGHGYSLAGNHQVPPQSETSDV